MMVAACVVIMLHAFVPHHHDDCCGEVECFFFSAHHHSHQNHADEHPSDACKLQDMLSHLVLSTRDENTLLADIMASEAQDYLQLYVPDMQCVLPLAVLPIHVVSWQAYRAALPAVPVMGMTPLRAPPALGEC